MMKSLAKLEAFKLDKKQMNVLGGKGYMCAGNQREFYCMTDWGHGYDIDNGGQQYVDGIIWKLKIG